MSDHLSYSLLITSKEMILFLSVIVLLLFKVLTFGCTTKKRLQGGFLLLIIDYLN